MTVKTFMSSESATETESSGTSSEAPVAMIAGIVAGLIVLLLVTFGVLAKRRRRMVDIEQVGVSASVFILCFSFDFGIAPSDDHRGYTAESFFLSSFD